MRLLPLDYAVRNLGRSPLRLVATISGTALVVLLIVGAAAFVRGMNRSLGVSPDNRNVILLGAGSEESTERSNVSPGVPGQIAAGIRGIRHELGQPFVSPEIHMALVSQRPGVEEELRAVFRGVTPAAFLVHPQVEIIEGRAPRQGRDEMMAGVLSAQKLGLPAAELAIGKRLLLDNREWTIVGQFRAPDTVMEAELWVPLTDLQVAGKRETISCVIITLDRAEFEDVDAWTKTRFDLELAAVSEREYYDSLRSFYRPVRAMVWGTAVLMAFAGLLGGLNTLYAAFAARTREVGMLQSLGFPRRAIFLSILQESLLAACAGSLLACALAFVFIDGAAVRFSLGVFQLSVDSGTVAAGLFAGLMVGILGAIPPSLQCLRLPIPQALKST